MIYPNIKEGSTVINNSITHPNLDTYFNHLPGKVTEVKPGPEYAGGKLITVKLHDGKEQTFYLNALKKV